MEYSTEHGQSYLDKLMLKNQYRSDSFDLALDFYSKCLPISRSMGRAVGYFSSSVFLACPEGFMEFFAKGGNLRIISSPLLSEQDARSIYVGIRDRHIYIRKQLLSEMLSDPSHLAKRKDEFVSWIVAKGLLSIRIALIKNRRGNELYHEKLGYFQDEGGQLVVFAGSANETYQALRMNFESLDVFRSWKKDERQRVARKMRDFERLWKNETKGLDIFSFVSIANKGLLHLRRSEPADVADGRAHTNTVEMNRPSKHNTISFEGIEETLSIPGHINLFTHQKTAMKLWFKARGSGILEMATGSGKTITALSCASKLYDALGPPLSIIVVCPYLHLVDQWIEEAREFGLDPIRCAGGIQAWRDELHVRSYNVLAGRRQIVSAVVSNDTFRSRAFADLIEQIDTPLLVVGDEVHNLGAPDLRRCLPDKARYRLGLSATPERWYDPVGTEVLIDYFGDTLSHYTLGQALEDGVLCPYKYFPHTVSLTFRELDAYQDLTSQIATALAKDASIEAPTGRLKHLLIQRARIVASAENKLYVLRELILPRRSSKHILVYCGDGRVQEEESNEEMRQIRAVTRMLGRELNMQVATYTADTSSDRRKELRHEFAIGNIQALVAIRCLDEGLDIPETHSAYILASSSNPRQYIQRRGRLLRRAPSKEFAEINDFLVVPPNDHRDPASPYFTTTRRLFGRELKRAIEFAKLAINGPEGMGKLLDIQTQLRLLDINKNENSHE